MVAGLHLTMFSPAIVDLAVNWIVSCMFYSFKKSCPPHEIRPSDWNLSLIFGASLVLQMSLLSCLRISTWPGRRAFFLFLCWPRGLAIYMSFPFGFVIFLVGSHVPFLFCHALWLIPKILRFRMTVFCCSPFHLWMTSGVVTVRSFCSELSELCINTWWGWSSTVRISLACLFLHPVGRRYVPKHHLLLGSIGHQPCVCLLLMRIDKIFGSRLMKSKRSPFLYCFGGTVQFIRYWRLELGHPILLFPPPSCEIGSVVVAQQVV